MHLNIKSYIFRKSKQYIICNGWSYLHKPGSQPASSSNPGLDWSPEFWLLAPTQFQNPKTEPEPEQYTEMQKAMLKMTKQKEEFYISFFGLWTIKRGRVKKMQQQKTYKPTISSFRYAYT